LHTDLLIPKIGIITDIRTETHDIKTFVIAGINGGKAFEHMPGQCGMLSVPGIGEAIFSISSSPTDTENMEFSIKAVGQLTNYMHKMQPQNQITIRGAYGNAFPVEEFKGRDLLFIAGGIGLAPLRSVIKYVFDNRGDYGGIDILYGARSADDLVFRNEIETDWKEQSNTNIYLTTDRPQENWNGNVGFVPAYLEQIGFDNNRTALICGPPIMIKFALESLQKMGFDKKQVYTTLELKMKCGIGKCGRCNIGSKYVCMDGPVFRCDELDFLPNEY